MERCKKWAQNANKIAPTLVGGSKNKIRFRIPVRARNAWAELGVDGRGVANMAPEPEFEGIPRLTSRMLARIQGFPDTWTFGKKKTAACRMIGNAFPPPVAKAVGEKIKECLENECTDCERTISLSRKKLFETNTLTLTKANVASNADTSSRGSKAIAKRIVDILVEEQQHKINVVEKNFRSNTWKAI